LKRGTIFEKDFQAVQGLFPKLKASYNSKNQFWYVKGELDICDTEGEYWGSFNILITVPHPYPYSLPIVKEISNHIKRDDNWHINNEGVCCLDITHKMLFIAARGINIFEYIRNYVYPYFANQLYKIKIGKYAGDEYKHHFAGINQFYAEDLNIHDPEIAILILEAILKGEIPGRNKKCICKKAKFKKCHLSAVEFLTRLPKERLSLDLKEFKSI
jgi:hypothetical protein